MEKATEKAMEKAMEKYITRCIPCVYDGMVPVRRKLKESNNGTKFKWFFM